MVESTAKSVCTFEKLTKNQLVKEITKRKLKKSRSKATLIERLNNYEGIHETNDIINNTEPSTTIQQSTTSLTDKDLEEIPYDELSIFEVSKSEGKSDSFFNDYIDFKKTIFADICEMKERVADINRKDLSSTKLIDNLNDQTKFLKKECSEKNKFIESLTSKIQSLTRHVEPILPSEHIESSWQVITQKIPIKSAKMYRPPEVSTSNRFQSLKFPGRCNEYNTSCELVDSDINHIRNTSHRPSIINKRPNIAITENYLKNSIPSWQKKTIPGKNTYANTVKKTKKVCLIGDSIIKRIRRKELNGQIHNATAYIKTFPGANIKHLHHYIEPTLIDDCPDAIILHIGTNDLKRAKNENQNPKEIAMKIIDIGNKCIARGVKQVFISEILQRSNVSLNNLVHEINEILYKLCITNNFFFIAHTNISMQHLYDEVHLNDDGMNVLSNNFINIINENLL